MKVTFPAAAHTPEGVLSFTVTIDAPAEAFNVKGAIAEAIGRVLCDEDPEPIKQGVFFVDAEEVEPQDG